MSMRRTDLAGWVVALVLTGEALRKFGGDSVAEFARNAAAFTASLRES